MESMIGQKRGKTTGTPPSLQTISTEGEIKLVNDSQHIRVLGGNLQNNMSWQSHLETGQKALLPQMRKQIGKLKHLGKLIPLRHRKNLGKGLICSKLNSLQPLWGGASDAYIKKAQVVLNTTARWMTGLCRMTRISKLMKAADLLTVKEQIKISTGIQTWKIVHLNLPQRLRERMHVTIDLLIEVDRPRLQFTQECFRWRATTLWNTLDLDLRQETSLGKFKRMLRRHILDQRPPDPPDPD